MNKVIDRDKLAQEYVNGVRGCNPQEFPTWEMLETAYVRGMQDQVLFEEGNL